MIRNIGAVTLAIAFAAAAIAAQTPTTGTPQTPQQASEHTMTIVGCVEVAPATPGTTGATATTRYNLTNARARKAGMPETAGTTGTASKEAGKSYRLSGHDEKLETEVGHWVEIVAVEEKPSRAEPTGTSGMEKPLPVLRVREIKMIAAKCQMP
ncbi:MAG: hypothetical protein ACRD26_06890 [Vicinamibacterales bacterium]